MTSTKKISEVKEESIQLHKRSTILLQNARTFLRNLKKKNKSQRRINHVNSLRRGKR